MTEDFTGTKGGWPVKKNLLTDRLKTVRFAEADRFASNLPRSVPKFEPPKVDDARAAERLALMELDIAAARWNRTMAIGYFELQRILQKNRAK
jgi:hypothetical protein